MWDAIRDMYGNQNNSARIFQIHREVANLHQEGKPFVSYWKALKACGMNQKYIVLTL
jgi:hypothetical protein